MTIPYEKIFSMARGRSDDPKELLLNKDDLTEIYTERLHAAIGNPSVRMLFSSIEFDDAVQMVNFELANPVEDASDTDFVIRVLSIGMAIEALEPRVNSIKNSAIMISGKEERKILDNHKSIMTLLDNMKVRLHREIANYGAMNNSYINGG